MVDKLADAINTIKTNERIGRAECTVPSNKLIKSILKIMKENGYIGDFEEFTVRYNKFLKIKLLNKINMISVVKPRFSVTKDDISKYEERYIPSKDFGIVVLTTNQGLLTNKEATAKGIGGSVIMYVY